MSTWVGALVKTDGCGDLSTVAAEHCIAIVGTVTPWLLVQAGVNFAGLHPPKFAEALSRELQTIVIAFFLQSAASVEELEHWENGQLLRRLEYSGDGGGWITQIGSPQAWEPEYFFADDEGTQEGEKWPLNLGDELSDEELARYERAKKLRDATSIMDLLSGGSAWSIHRLCLHFGVDPRKPGAIFTPPTNWKPRLIIAAIIAFFIGMSLLGALTRR